MTKIIKHAEYRAPAASRRTPREVLHGFHRGAGGTCFSLTATLLHLVRAMGFDAEPILADRRYGADTHCALIVWMDEHPYLLDPGYLIVEPIPLCQAATGLVVPTRFNQLELIPGENGRLELHTTEQGNRRYRLTFKTNPADDQAFLQAWDASFDWEGMHYPVLTRVTEHQQRYLRGTHLQTRTLTEVQREDIPERHWCRASCRSSGSARNRPAAGGIAWQLALAGQIPMHVHGAQSSLPVLIVNVVPSSVAATITCKLRPSFLYAKALMSPPIAVLDSSAQPCLGASCL